jgi:hypothetical protein
LSAATRKEVAIVDYQMPPAAYYSHTPRGVKIITGTDAMVRMFCRGRSDYGCALQGGTASFNGKPIRCLIVVRSDVPSNLHRDILNHEIAHCNGWQHYR